mgnify:FL=1
MVINNGIKEAREKKMMTQNDLAKRIGVDVNVIKDWEENNTMISLKDVRRLTKYLDATSDQLLLGCTKPPIDFSGLTEDQIEEIFSLFITNLKKLNRHHRKINMKTNRSTVRDFGSKVYYIRVRLLGISQEELSYKLNISRTSVQSYERSSEVDLVNRIISLSKLSKVSTDYLIFNDCPLQLSSYELDNERYSILKQLVQFYVKYNTIHN